MYEVERSHDSLGGIYIGGPLEIGTYDVLGEAQREVIARGGVIIRDGAHVYCEGEWIPLAEFNSRVGRQFGAGSGSRTHEEAMSAASHQAKADELLAHGE